ncbi:hypothetical protein T10_10524 [Trichinella papuae]|uniref:Uncharacterized protein n=1 Tax=Trichinella papuae TaxID=268474 RepID=A0A0V1N7C2_9BILA|nr:hypothetical protein T10_10524 [Trichinella papuae]
MKHSGRMSSSKGVGGRKVNSCGDDPVENNKAVADPPAVTANPLHTFGFCGGHISRNRFDYLLRFIHFNDNNGIIRDQNHPQFDWFCKVRPLVDHSRVGQCV